MEDVSHLFRAVGGTLLAGRYKVQKVLGHSTPLMTERYAHLQPDHLQGAVRALDVALSGVDTQMDTCSFEASGVSTQSPAKPLKKL
jgi:hypothetical protein